MTHAIAEIETPVEQTEAYQELLARHGRKTGKIPPELISPPRALVRSTPGMANAGRCDRTQWCGDWSRSDGTICASRRAPPTVGFSACTSPGGPERGSALSNGLARRRSDRRSLQLSGFPQELSRILQARPCRAGTPPHPARGSCSRR